MGRALGNLRKNTRGIVEYGISPFEQRAFAKAFTQGFPNLIKRFVNKLFIVGVPIGSAIIVFRHLKYFSVEEDRKRYMPEYAHLYEDEK